MSLEYQSDDIFNTSQCDNGACSLRNVFHVHWTSAVVLDMPLLTDLSPSRPSTEVFERTNNNNNSAIACGSFIPTNQIEPSPSINIVTWQESLVESSQVESGSTGVIDDDISEFLIFRKKDDIDPKLKNECYIKLSKSEIDKQTVVKFKKPKIIRKPPSRTTRNSVKSNCKTKISDVVSAVKPKYGKLKHPDVDLVQINRHPKIVLKLVRDKNSSSDYQCHIVHRIQDKFALKDCTVLLKRLRTINTRAKKKGRRNRRKMDCPLDLSMRKTKNDQMTMNLTKKPQNSLSNDIESIYSPPNKKKCILTPTTKTSNRITDHPIYSPPNKETCILTPTTKTSNRITDHPIYSPPNKETCILTPTTKTSNRITDHPIQATSVLSKINNGITYESADIEKVSEATEAGNESKSMDPDDDDNCSVASEISLFAPSLSDILNSPTRDESIDEALNQAHVKKYRIPKKKVTVSPTPVQQQSEDLMMADAVERIFAATIKNSPKMLSPISDTPKRFGSMMDKRQKKNDGRAQILQLATKTIEQTEAKKTVQLKEPQLKSNANEAIVTAKSCHPIIRSNPEMSSELHEPLAETKDSTSPSQGLWSTYKSKIDFKNMQNFVINAAVATNMSVSTGQSPKTLRVHLPQISGEQPHHMPQPSEPIDSVEPNVNITSSLYPQGHQQLSFSPEKVQRYRSAAMGVFEQPCINFLNGKPCRFPSACPYNHVLPHPGTILAKMKTFSNEKLEFICTNFVLKHRLSFEQYFPVICELFAVKQMPEVLETLVPHCETYRRYDFFELIFKGLVHCRKSNSEALEIIVDRCTISEESDKAIREIATANPA